MRRAHWLDIKNRPAEMLGATFSGGGRASLRCRIEAGAYLLYVSLVESNFIVSAAAISYSFVFSLIPLLTTSLAFFTAFPGLASERERLRTWVFAQLLPGAVQDVQSYIERFSERAATAGAVSSLIFFVTMLIVFQSAENTFNAIWRVERGRSWGERLQALAGFLTIGAIVAAALVVLRREADVLAVRVGLSRVPGGQASVHEVALEATGLFVAWIAFTLANKLLPNTRVRWWAAAIGGVVAGTIWHLLKSGFTWYIDHFSSYKNIYGALGTIPAFFLWVYLSMTLLLAGGYTAFVAQNLESIALTYHQRTRGNARAYHAAAVCAALARAFANGEGALSVGDIAGRLSVTEYFVKEALTRLAGSRFVVLVPATHAAEEDRYMLGRSAEAITLLDIASQTEGVRLQVPELKDPSPFHGQARRVFAIASRLEQNALKRVTVADIAALRIDDPDLKTDIENQEIKSSSTSTTTLAKRSAYT